MRNWEITNNKQRHCKGYEEQGLAEISGSKISSWIFSWVYTCHKSEKAKWKQQLALSSLPLTKHTRHHRFSLLFFLIFPSRAKANQRYMCYKDLRKATTSNVICRLLFYKIKPVLSGFCFRASQNRAENRELSCSLTGLSSPSKTSSFVKDFIQSIMLMSPSSAALDRVPDDEDDDEDEPLDFCELKIKE